MKKRLYLPGVNKRILTVKAKRFLSFACAFIIIVGGSLSGNIYLKSKQNINNTLFWQPEDGMSLTVHAMAENIDTLTKERDSLLTQIKKQEKPIIMENPPEAPPIQKPILNKKIKSIAHNLGGLMTGHSTYLYNKCIEYGIDPLMMAAIIKHESTNGTSLAIRRQNNIAGFMGKDDRLMTFNSINDSIDFMVKLFKKYYINEGRTTLEKIQPKYCPIGARNDPTGLNIHWLPGTKAFYKIMVEGSM